MLAVAQPTYAGPTALIEDTGWQYDQVDVVGNPSEGSPWVFTVQVNDAPGIFSLSDGFIAGDTYTVSVNGGAGISSVFGGGVNTNFDMVPNNFGPAANYFAADFLDPTFSHLQLYLAPGLYSISITGDGKGGLPAGFGVRLDSPVPEPATWALMITGFGLAGIGLRRRRGVAAA